MGKYFLYLSSAVVVAYALALLFHVQGAADLGIDCLFTDRDAENDIDDDPRPPRISWVASDLEVIGPRPQPGDRVVALGGSPVPTFLHVKRQVAELAGEEVWQQRSAVFSSDDADALRESVVSVPGNQGKEGPFALLGRSLARIGSTRWVRIDFLTAPDEIGAAGGDSISTGKASGTLSLPDGGGSVGENRDSGRDGRRDDTAGQASRRPAVAGSGAPIFTAGQASSGTRSDLILKSAWLPLRTLPNRFLMLSAGWFLLEAIILTIGALVVLNRPGDRSAVMFYALCVVHVVSFLGAFHWSSLVGTRVLVYPFVFCTILLAPATLHFYLVFPRPSRWILRRPLLTLLAIYSMPAAWTVLMFVCLWQAHRLYEMGAAPADVTHWLGILSVSISGYLFVAVGMFVVGWGVLLSAHRRARTAAQRNQIRWVILAVALATGLTGYLLILAIVDRAAFAFSDSTRLALYLTSVLFTLAYAVSITRYKLMQVGRLVNRGILYVMISLAATALYCLLVGVGTALLGRYYFRWENAVAAGLAAMLVAVLLGWLRDRFQTTLDRRYIREKYQLNDAMRRLSEAVDELVEPEALARQFLQSAASTVGVNRGAVYLRDVPSGRFLLAIASRWPMIDESIETQNPLLDELGSESVLTSRVGRGTLPSPGQQELRDCDADVAVALELDGDVTGVAILGEKAQAAPYSTEDLNFLSALARTTTLALRNARESRRIEAQKRRLEAQVEKISQLQQQVHVLQGELLTLDPAPSSEVPYSSPSASDNPEVSLREANATQEIDQRGGRRGRRADIAASSTSSGAGNRKSAGANLARHIAEDRPEAAGGMIHNIRGSSPAVKKMLRDAQRVAGTDSSVLVRGESGTGKELLARAIHDNGSRAGRAFVPVHCAALSAGLLESELFGHVKGAFTGADRDRVGRFQLADGGTLFLDEIGDISLETQTKLLRVLEARSFERVGAAETIHVDVRLVTATHQNLEELIRQGRFRQDLFYRLNVISVWCPPLRNRRADIFELSLYFLRQFAHRLAGNSGATAGLSSSARGSSSTEYEEDFARLAGDPGATGSASADAVGIAKPPAPNHLSSSAEASISDLSSAGAFHSEHRRPILRGIEDDAMEALLNYNWPGNVRQLQNAIERACVLAETAMIRRADLPAEIIHAGQAVRGGRRSRRSKREAGSVVEHMGATGSASEHFGASGTDGKQRGATGSASGHSGGTAGLPSSERPGSGVDADPYDVPANRDQLSVADALLGQHSQDFDSSLPHKMTALEKDRLQSALAQAAGNKAAAARLLGMPRATFLYKLKKHGIEWRKG